MRDTDVLRFHAQSHLSMPAEVDLYGTMLGWATINAGLYASQEFDKYQAQFAARPVAGVLRDFIGLAGATPERVLAFARARGVLGIDPFVTAIWREKDKERHPWDATFSYQEPVACYTRLAAHFAGILRIMGAIKAGREVDEGDLLRCVGDRMGATGRRLLSDSAVRSPFGAHCLLWFAVSECWKQTTIKLMPSSVAPTSPTEPESPYPSFALSHSQEIAIEFGGWEENPGWDIESSLRTRPNCMIAFPEEGEGLDTSEHPAGEWLMPYRDYATESLYAPHAGSRPSALYSALVFQLMQEVTLQEDTFFCSQCAKTYTYDPDRAKKPAKGEDAGYWGMSKPRKDRATAFCSERCRRLYDTEDKRRQRAAARRREYTGERPAGQ